MNLTEDDKKALKECFKTGLYVLSPILLAFIIVFLFQLFVINKN